MHTLCFKPNEVHQLWVDEIKNQKKNSSKGLVSLQRTQTRQSVCIWWMTTTIESIRQKKGIWDFKRETLMTFLTAMSLLCFRKQIWEMHVFMFNNCLNSFFKKVRTRRDTASSSVLAFKREVCSRLIARAFFMDSNWIKITFTKKKQKSKPNKD